MPSGKGIDVRPSHFLNNLVLNCQSVILHEKVFFLTVTPQLLWHLKKFRISDIISNIYPLTDSFLVIFLSLVNKCWYHSSTSAFGHSVFQSTVYI